MGDGTNLTPEEANKIKETLPKFKKRFKRSFCRLCGDEISFQEAEGRFIPHSLDGEAHWQACPFKGFAQKKASLNIVKMFAVYFVMKHGIDLEAEVGLTKHEAQIVAAILEKAFQETKEETPIVTEEKLPDGEDLAFTPEPTDIVGDPDEDIAPAEEEIEATAPEEFISLKED